MANEKVLGETKRVLEMMEESEEKVSLLNQDLKQNKTLCLQIEQNLKELRQLNNKCSADLEDNQNLKSNIKNYNAELVTYAQQIYSCGQQLYADLNLHETEIDKIEELLNKNEDKFLKKLNDYNLEEERLKAELELLTQEEIKETERNELEIRTVNTENEDLLNELNNVNKKIEECEIYVKENEELDQQETEYRREIARMEESVKSINTEISTISELLQDMDKNKGILTTDREDHISDLNKEIEAVRNEIIAASKLLEENKYSINEINCNINDIESDSRKKEDNYEQYNKDLNDIEIYIKKTKENMQNEIDYCEKSIVEYEEIFRIQKEHNEKVRRELNSFKIKIEEQTAVNNVIVLDIHSFEEKRSKLDLKKELDAKQSELKQLKATRQDLKEQYNKKHTEIQNEIKKIQEEIDNIETKNKKLQNDIDTAVLEIDQLKTSEEEKVKENQIHIEKSKELDTQIQNLTFEMAKAKAESIKNKQRTDDSQIITTPKHFLIPSSSNKEKKLKVQRHWDSDSSIEGENRRFSELAKQKIKMKRVRK